MEGKSMSREGRKRLIRNVWFSLGLPVLGGLSPSVGPYPSLGLAPEGLPRHFRDGLRPAARRPLAAFLLL